MTLSHAMKAHIATCACHRSALAVEAACSKIKVCAFVRCISVYDVFLMLEGGNCTEQRQEMSWNQGRLCWLRSFAATAAAVAAAFLSLWQLSVVLIGPKGRARVCMAATATASEGDFDDYIALAATP